MTKDDQSNGKTFMTANNFSRLGGFSRGFAYKLAKEKIVPTYRFGSAIRFKRTDVEEYILRCRQDESRGEKTEC